MGKLKERLLKREQDLADGKFESPDLKGKDPIKWEILYTRLEVG